VPVTVAPLVGNRERVFAPYQSIRNSSPTDTAHGELRLRGERDALLTRTRRRELVAGTPRTAGITYWLVVPSRGAIVSGTSTGVATPAAASPW
jgi:hypothetical protein